MNTAQEKLDNLQFIHSLWLNELSHSSVELSIYQNRLEQIDSSELENIFSEDLGLIRIEIEQLKLAADFIKKDILKHVTKITKAAGLNGELKHVHNSNHDETRERFQQFHVHFKKVKKKFYNLVPITDGT